MSKLISVAEAWQRLSDALPATRPPIERLAVSKSLQRVLASASTASSESPPVNTSAMDGFAFNSQDVEIQQAIPISQRIPAGTVAQPLEKGTAARIFTGAMMPANADSVVLQENCEYNADTVTIRSGLEAGKHVRVQGEDIALGDVLLKTGHRLRAQDIGFLISGGCREVDVYSRLKVGVIATGDELVDVNSGPLPPGKIYESNAPMIEAALTTAGFNAKCYRAADTQADTQRVLQQAVKENDAVLTIGGVSVGEEDHVQAALRAFGNVDFWKINVKPGKPFLLADIDGRPVMGLPGNPVSAFVTYTLFGFPFLQALSGQVSVNNSEQNITTVCPPKVIPAVADFSRTRPSSRQDYLRGQIIAHHPQLLVAPVGVNKSSMQGALCAADVLIVVPPDSTIEPGDAIGVIVI